MQMNLFALVFLTITLAGGTQVLAAPTRVTTRVTPSSQDSTGPAVARNDLELHNHGAVQPRSPSPDTFEDAELEQIDTRETLFSFKKKNTDRSGIISGCGGSRPAGRAGILQDCNPPTGYTTSYGFRY